MTTKIRQEGYTDFLRSLDPVTIALVHCAFRIDRAAYLESKTDTFRARFRAKILGLDDDHFDVQTSLALIVTMEDRLKPLARFTATYDIHFHGKEISERNVQKFINSDVRLVIWPYFRELVNNASGRMHVPPIILPISENSGSSNKRPSKKA